MVALAVALVAAGCGGDDSSTTSPTQSSPTAEATTAEPDSKSSGTEKNGDQGKKPSGKSGGGGGSDENGSGESSGKDSESGSKSSDSGARSNAAPDSDTSIQEFGKEASGAEREAASRTLEAYFQARASSDNQAACSNLSKGARDQLAELAAASPKIKGKGCVAAFDSIDQVAPPSARANPMTGPVSSLRVEGDRAFAIFPGKGGATYTIQMSKDGSTWKVAAIVPYQLG